MEVKAYIRFMRKYWLLILLVFLITFAATAYFTFTAKPIYESTASYIVRLSTLAADQKTTISALDTLSNRSEIASTYAKVANSRLIKKQAAERLGLSSSDKSNAVVNSQILPGTNVLSITVQSDDPKVASDYANAIGAETVTYIQSLYEIYSLEILDEATPPRSPIKPNKIMNLGLGAVFGLVLGIVLAFFVEYLRAPLETKAVFNILDEKTGIYNKRFLMFRLHQELNRSRRNEGILSFALVNIDHRRLLDSLSASARLNAVRSVLTMLGKNLRDEDVMASFSDSEVGILLPDMSGKDAKSTLERLLESVSVISIELGSNGDNMNLHGAAGVAPFYGGDPAGVDDLITRARNALESMRESTYGRVMISNEGSVKEARVKNA